MILENNGGLEMDEYVELLEKTRKENEQYLEIFKKDLQTQGLKDKTIEKHIFNIDFYINDFLNYYDIQNMPEGCYDIDTFLGDWFIRKASWSSSANIKANAASIKKFYKSMLDHGFVKLEDYNFLCLTIKEDMERWLLNLKEYETENEDDFY